MYTLIVAQLVPYDYRFSEIPIYFIGKLKILKYFANISEEDRDTLVAALQAVKKADSITNQIESAVLSY